MKVTALRLLEDLVGDGEPEPFEIDLTSRKFCDVLDAHKALVLTSPRREDDNHDDSGVWSVQDFADLLVGLNLTYYPYIGGAAPRTIIPVQNVPSDLPIIFTANESPPDQPIRTYQILNRFVFVCVGIHPGDLAGHLTVRAVRWEETCGFGVLVSIVAMASIPSLLRGWLGQHGPRRRQDRISLCVHHSTFGLSHHSLPCSRSRGTNCCYYVYYNTAFHHEIAQIPNPPEYIFFYCERPAETGGQTPLIDSTKVYRFVQDNHADFLLKLKRHGVRYIRTLPPQDDPTSPLGRSYQNSWNVATPQELDDKLAAIDGCEWKWHDNGDVTITSEPIAAIRLVSDHIQNAVHQWTFCNSLVAAFLGWQDSRNDRTKALVFGNNDPMDLDVLQSIADFMKEHRVLYTWKAGDVLAINNRLVMHSREPFTGPRRVLASIWGPPLDDTVVHYHPPTALGLRPESYFQPLNPNDPLVFGFWKVSKDVCDEVAYQAIRNGYRRLDCACDYGNEEQVGRGIRRALDEGLVQRKDLFITSKLWNTYHKPEHVLLACQKSLQDLGLDYLDEYLIHFPISMEYVPIEKKYPPEWTNLDGKMVLVPNDMCATWTAMEDLVDRGLARRIGVCNFTTQLLRQILSTCRIRPTTLQVELHPHNSQQHLIRFARDAGMQVTAFSVLGASSYLELNMATDDDVLLTNAVVTRIAEAHRKTPAQILIRWAVQRNTFPLCKTSNPSRMIENRQVFDFYLTARDMKALDALNQNRRYNDPGAFCEPGMGTFCPIYE